MRPQRHNPDDDAHNDDQENNDQGSPVGMASAGVDSGVWMDAHWHRFLECPAANGGALLFTYLINVDSPRMKSDWPVTLRAAVYSSFAFTAMLEFKKYLMPASPPMAEPSLPDECA